MSQPSWVGQTIGGRYQIEARLGQGGMSAVYRATDPNLRRAVAIKLIHAHLTGDPEFVRRFEGEAAAVAQLRHPNIIQVFDFNHDGETYYMVLEFVPGETLHARLARLAAENRRMPPDELISIAANVADAIAYAHQRGLIHRDIKPANVMINPQGQAVLMDFGIAKIMGSAAHTATGTVVGTAQYISPEQVRGERPSERSDIYSLGVTLFEMAAGKPPFDGDSAMSIMLKHVNEPVPDLRTLSPGTPPALIAIIERAMSKDPARRYQSGSELADALRQARQSPGAGQATMLEPMPSAPAGGATVLEPAPSAFAAPAAPPPAAPPPMGTAARPAAPAPPPAAPQPAFTGAQPAAPAARPAAGGGSKLGLIVGVAVVGVLCLVLTGAGALAAMNALRQNDPTAAPTQPAATVAPTSAPTEAVAATGAPTDEPAPSPTLEPPTPEPTEVILPFAEGMVLIPGGEFQMGSEAGQTDERPVHLVRVSDFYLDEYEVTNARYQACVDEGACAPLVSNRSDTRAAYFGNPEYAGFPVLRVTYDQAVTFCAWDFGKRLPTEAEWEYAATGGDGRRYPWGNDFDGSLLPTTARDTVAVGSFPGGASPFGIYDLAGNVLEWVADYYDSLYYAEAPEADPLGPEFGNERVLRGGSFGNPNGQFYTTTRRYHLPPGATEVDVGFRCAITAP
jgi:formylglycine-generating enzyme required for sulfatase activity